MMLLKIAQFLFSEGFVAAVVEPSIADLRFEVDAAGSDRRHRRRALWRGYAAFWRLTLVAPFDAWSSMRRVAFASTATTLMAIPVLGGWIVGVAGAAALVAVLIHSWYERHPSIVAAPAEGPWRSPQINFSSTEVAGNVGGLIFVVGTIVIVCLGLPPVVLFLLAVTVTASMVAWGLVAWHTRHPRDGELTLVGSLKVKT
jgi:hypothetical protein